MTTMLKAKDYKSLIKPVWCPGCGDFGVLSAMTKAFAELQLVPEQIGVISGIGCSSRLPAFLASYGFHGIHGRALPLAAGLKTARPELTVLAVGGDGDGFSIGGNHFLHACRRNMDLTYLVMDNEVYGMTKGQASPTTDPQWTRSKMTPHGTGMPRFRPLDIAFAAGAGFIARGFGGAPIKLTRLIVEGLRHPGFAFIHVLSPCRTFRPEQLEWKSLIHPWPEGPTHDRRHTAEQLRIDDGFATGLLHREKLPAWRAAHQSRTNFAEVEQEFLV